MNKNLKKQETQDIFNKTRLAFNTVRLTEILQIYLEEQLLMKYYVIKHLMLLKIQKTMDIKEVLLQWLYLLLLTQEQESSLIQIRKTKISKIITRANIRICT